MARKRHHSVTYLWCQTQFKTKLKSRNYKSIFKDCRLYDRGTHFEITHNKFKFWEQGSKGWERITEEVSLATITPADVLTMTYDQEISITVCNRLTSLTGYPVGLNKRQYGHHKQHVRVYCIDSGWQNSEPYFAGMKWDVARGGAVLLNPQPDLKLVVNNEHVQKVRKEFDALRKLTRTMVRLGSFDDFAKLYMQHRWQIKLTDYKDLAAIDPNNPIGDDALAIIAFGGYNISRPDMHYWDHTVKQYIKRDPHTVMREWLMRAMERGLKEMRQTYYRSNDGYIEVAA
jgi:hypothetical protein